MIIQKSKINVKNDLVISYLDNFEDSLFFDIETTGLYWKNSHLYLIGAASFENSGWSIQQWFLDQPFDEESLLNEFSKLCKGKKRIVHFNGNGFDIPYLQRKYSFYQMENPFTSLESLDLYRKARPFQKLFGLPSMKLKSIEQFLNLEREDTYTGKELIQVYTDYLRSRDNSRLAALMQHNLEDVTGLIHLLPLLSYENVKKGKYTVQYAAFKDDILTVGLELQSSVPVPVSENFGFYYLSLKDHRGTLKIYAENCVMKHFFSDYKNYYYLPLEDQSIHKSVGAFVDRDHREKARASNCYQKLEGTFLPQLNERFHPVFFVNYKSKPAYFPYHEEMLLDMEKLLPYTYDYITTL